MARKASRTSLGSKGFTIVELLIVIVVIAILAAITIVSYTGINREAKQAQVAAFARNFSQGLSVWRVETGTTTVPSTTVEVTAVLDQR